jgi:hypothetical protein
MNLEWWKQAYIQHYSDRMTKVREEEQNADLMANRYPLLLEQFANKKEVLYFILFKHPKCLLQTSGMNF